jgi:hypothetical protein
MLTVMARLLCPEIRREQDLLKKVDVPNIQPQDAFLAVHGGKVHPH